MRKSVVGFLQEKYYIQQKFALTESQQATAMMREPDDDQRGQMWIPNKSKKIKKQNFKWGVAEQTQQESNQD